jgi:hypothetical protein
MLPSYQELNIISEKLRKAVVATLNLKATDRVFAGNEEKMFLYSLMLHMPNSQHKTTVKIKDHKEITLYKMIDIWNAEIEKRQKNKQAQILSERIRYFLIAIRALLIKTRHLIFLKHRLKHASTIVHYTAHLRYASFTIPDLTSLFFKCDEKKDIGLRNLFNINLSKVGLEPILVEYLTSLFPTSHLESYLKFTAHEMSNIKKIDTVVTSMAGICGDPLLSFLVKNNNCRLVYVQHGGGYGLNKNHLTHKIEDDGADLMYYWGTGDNNVYPTRYRDKYFSKMCHKAIIVLSDKEDNTTIKPYVGLVKKLTNKHISCIIAAHPNGPKFGHKYIQLGIGYRQHEKAQLVIYDRIGNSLFYTRILTKRPFLIVDSYVLYPQSDNAIKLIALLREAGILIPFNEVEQNINYWMQFSPKEAKLEFEKKAHLIFNHVLNQPKIQEIF